MNHEDTIKFVLAVLGVVSLTGGFLYWHFKTINSFKDDIHKLEIKVKDLEHRDQLQQQTIDQLDSLYPIIKNALEKLPGEKRK
jgi:hypothetical protein